MKTADNNKGPDKKPVKVRNLSHSSPVHSGAIPFYAIFSVDLAGCRSALNPTVVYSTEHSKAVVPVLVLLFVALWFILRGDLF